MPRKTTKRKPAPEVVGEPVGPERNNVFHISVEAELFGKPEQTKREIREAVESLQLRLPSVKIRQIRTISPPVVLFDQDA